MADMKLKPCPFCGGDANWRWGLSRFGYYSQVRCDDCGAATKPVTIPEDLCRNKDFYDDDGFWESEPFKKSTRLWNVRTRRKKE